MWYCILSAVILVVVLFLLFIFCTDEDMILGVTTILFIAIVLTPMINGAIMEKYTIEYQEVQYTITGLEMFVDQKESLKGCFVLGTGSLNGGNSKELKYIYFANTEYGKQLKSVGINKVYIKETDDEAPKYVKIIQRVYRDVTWVDKLFGHKDKTIELNSKETGEILVVPTNTIKIEYNIEI